MKAPNFFIYYSSTRVRQKTVQRVPVYTQTPLQAKFDTKTELIDTKHSSVANPTQPNPTQPRSDPRYLVSKVIAEEPVALALTVLFGGLLYPAAGLQRRMSKFTTFLGLDHTPKQQQQNHTHTLAHRFARTHTRVYARTLTHRHTTQAHIYTPTHSPTHTRAYAHTHAHTGTRARTHTGIMSLQSLAARALGLLAGSVAPTSDVTT